MGIPGQKELEALGTGCGWRQDNGLEFWLAATNSLLLFMQKEMHSQQGIHERKREPRSTTKPWGRKLETKAAGEGGEEEEEIK